MSDTKLERKITALRFGAAVHKARLELGLTVKQLAADTGVPWRQMYKIETQGVTPLSVNYKPLCKALGLDPAEYTP